MSQNNPSTYISIEDAAELTGYAVKYLRKLAKSGEVKVQKIDGTLLVLWTDVIRLANTQKPFWVALPDNAVGASNPDPNLLLYTKGDESAARYSQDYFYDKVELGNCIEWMRRMPDGIVQSVVTSPPYWGVRKYPGDQQIPWTDGSHVGYGEESNVEGYVAHTVEILRHLKRVLREDGTIWWNLGDTYQTRAYLRESSTERLRAMEGDRTDTWRLYPNKRYSSGHSYLKDKDLTLVPFMVGMAAEHLGFYVRSVIIWYKDNTLFEPIKDRPTTAHEYILLLAKSRFYKYDKNRETEIAVTGEAIKRIDGKDDHEITDERNLRSVWQFPTSSRHGEHTAAFPLELPLRCLKLCTTPGDLVFDPFAGSGTTLAAAKLLGCHYFGCDIVEQSIQDSKRRLLSPSKPLNGNGKSKEEINKTKRATSKRRQDKSATEISKRNPTLFEPHTNDEADASVELTPTD